MDKLQKRQGDIFFQAVSAEKVRKTKPKTDNIIAYGEVTGHSHKITSPAISEMESYVDENGDIFVLSKTKDIVVEHDEHAAITLPANQWYCISRQREYDPLSEEKRIVAD